MSWRDTLATIIRRPVFDRLVDLAWRDAARPVEWIAVGFLLNFIAAFWLVPDLTARDSYAAFAWLPQPVWTAIFSAILAVQAIAIASDRWRAPRAALARYMAMALSLAFFATIATAFWVGGVATTANGAYIVLSLAALFATIYLLFEAARHG